jgi:hypothetical protein
MKTFLTLLRWDLLLLHRNQLFIFSAAVAAVYIGVFHLLLPLGDLSALLIVLIFNDPVITGFLFGGILWMFDKNQNTLQAISVLPLPLPLYLLSKATVLSVLATVLALAMVLATRGLAVHWVPLLAGVFFSAFTFSYAGFAIGALSRNFNYFLLYSLPLFLLTGLPFLGIFNVTDPVLWAWVPTFGGISLLQKAFYGPSVPGGGWLYLHLIVWCYLSYRIGTYLTQKTLL